MTVESVLIITVLVTLFMFVSKQFKDNELLAIWVQGPWLSISGMIQNGKWAEAKDSMDYHPNSPGRLLTIKGEPPK